MTALQVSGVFGNGRIVVEGNKLAFSFVCDLVSLLAPAASASCFPSPLLLPFRLLALSPSLSLPLCSPTFERDRVICVAVTAVDSCAQRLGAMVADGEYRWPCR